MGTESPGRLRRKVLEGHLESILFHAEWDDSDVLELAQETKKLLAAYDALKAKTLPKKGKP